MYYSPKLHDFGRLKKYSDHHFKLTVLRAYSVPGFESEVGQHVKHFVAKGEANDEKLQRNRARARNTIYELALCNPWELFVTFTLDQKKYDRKDLPKFQKNLSQFFRDYRKKYGVQVKYLLIPERHKDGCWHMHGFLMGLPLEHLHEFQQSEHLPYRILERMQKGKRVFTWEAYAKKFGFANIEIIENHEAASHYMLKYVTKETVSTIQELNAHMYYASQGLQRATLEQEGIVADKIFTSTPVFSGDYFSVFFFSDLKRALSYFAIYDESEVNESLPCLPQTISATG